MNLLINYLTKNTVVLDQDTYYIDETISIVKPITIKAKDGCKVIIKAAGYDINNWREKSINGITVFVADILEGVNFKRLFVNGKSANASQYPQEGYLKMRHVDNLDLDVDHKTILFNGSNEFYFDELPKLYNEKSITVLVKHYWLEEIMPVKEIDWFNRKITTTNTSTMVMRKGHEDNFADFKLLNVKEGLVTPGDWYFDNSEQKVYYVPRENETCENISAFSPKCSKFFIVKNCEDVVFENLDFQCLDIHPDPFSCSVPHVVIKEGVNYASAFQAAENITGAIDFIKTKNCRITNCDFTNLSGYAVCLLEGSSYNTIEKSTFTECGAGAIRITGSYKLEDISLHNHHNIVDGNLIYNCAKIYQNACGILVQHAYCIKLSNNEIHDLTYSGISVGWSWLQDVFIYRDNLIENNHIYNIGLNILSDVAAIYVIGLQPNMQIIGNKIHDVHADEYGGIGIYLDDFTAYAIVENNVVENVSHYAFFLHSGKNNIVRNNSFSYSNGATIGLGTDYGHNQMVFYHNKITSKGEPLFAGDYGILEEKKYFDCVNNEWICKNGNPVFNICGEKNIEEWRRLGYT